MLGLLGLIGIAFLVAARPPLPRSLGYVGLAAAGFAAAIVVSASRHGDIGDAQGHVVALVAPLAGLVVAATATDVTRKILLDGVRLAAVVIAASAWIGSAFRLEPWALVAGGLWRGASTLTYANATATFLAMVLPILLRPAQENRFRDRATVFAVLVGLMATLSRGAAVALVITFVYLLRQPSQRAILRDYTSVALGAVLSGVGLIAVMPADASRRPWIAVVALAAGAAVPAVRLRGRRLLSVAAIGLAGVAAVALTTSAAGSVVNTRLSTGSEDRIDEWRESVRLVRDNPVFGVGPGQYVLIYEKDDQQHLAKYAHNEYLQIAAELGAVGLAAAVAGLGLIWVSKRRNDPSLDAALISLAVSGFFDFSWHFPLILVTAGVVAGLRMREPTHAG